MRGRVEISTEDGKVWQIVVNGVHIEHLVTELHIHVDQFGRNTEIDLRLAPLGHLLSLDLSNAEIGVLSRLEDS